MDGMIDVQADHRTAVVQMLKAEGGAREADARR